MTCACGATPPRPPEPILALRNFGAVVRWELAAARFRELHAGCTTVVAA